MHVHDVHDVHDMKSSTIFVHILRAKSKADDGESNLGLIVCNSKISLTKAYSAAICP